MSDTAPFPTAKFGPKPAAELCSAEGALELVRRLKLVWGADAKFTIETLKLSDSELGAHNTICCVRSNLIGGLPPK